MFLGLLAIQLVIYQALKKMNFMKDETLLHPLMNIRTESMKLFKYMDYHSLSLSAKTLNMSGLKLFLPPDSLTR